MPLDNLDPTDTFDIIETKIDATIDEVNALRIEVDDAESRLDDAEARLDNLEARNVNNLTWSGTQTMTNTYTVIGTLSFTTPNDGISRYYNIMAEIASRIELDNVDSAWDVRLYNITDASSLASKSVVWDEPTGTVGSFIVNPQNVLLYAGLIGANKNIELQIKYTTSTSTMDVKSGTLIATEIYKA
jgi:hypothetical protein